MRWNNPYKWPKIHGFAWGYNPYKWSYNPTYNWLAPSSKSLPTSTSTWPSDSVKAERADTKLSSKPLKFLFRPNHVKVLWRYTDSRYFTISPPKINGWNLKMMVWFKWFSCMRWTMSIFRVQGVYKKNTNLRIAEMISAMVEKKTATLSKMCWSKPGGSSTSLPVMKGFYHRYPQPP